MENRHGPVVDARLTQATGYAEREAAIEPDPRPHDASPVFTAAVYHLMRIRNLQQAPT